MNQNDFELLFRMECRQHGVSHAGLSWFEPKTVNSSLALAYGEELKVSFSTRCLLQPYDVAIEVIRHEIAHLLDYQHNGGWPRKNNRYDFHGKSWKAWCKIVKCPARTKIDCV